MLTPHAFACAQIDIIAPAFLLVSDVQLPAAGVPTAKTETQHINPRGLKCG
jgi:hypothetical protein